MPGIWLVFLQPGGSVTGLKIPAPIPMEISIKSHTFTGERMAFPYAGPLNALVGVFLGPNPPNDSLAPPPGSNFTPALQQVFLIGAKSIVIVPAGATRLFLGTMDGFGWWDNSGAFAVTISVGCSITAPPDGSSPASQYVVLNGTADPGSEIRIIVDGYTGGQDATTESDGKWEAVIKQPLVGIDPDYCPCGLRNTNTVQVTSRSRLLNTRRLF